MRKILPLFVLVSAFTVSAQTITKGSVVTPKFSEKAAKSAFKAKLWQLRVQYSVTVSASPNGRIAVNDDYDWADKGFPWMSRFYVKEFRASDNKPGRVLIVNGAEFVEISLPPNVDTGKTLDAVLFVGTPDDLIASDYFRKIENTKLATIFPGRFASIPQETQRKLARRFDYAENLFSEGEFKEKAYLTINAPNGTIYNTIQRNAAERAARTAEKALADIRVVYESVGRIDKTEGIKFETTIYSRNFVDEKGISPHEEKFEIYVPFDLLRKFISADITNQDLVDGSIILVNGSRVKVNLTNFS